MKLGLLASFGRPSTNKDHDSTTIGIYAAMLSMLAIWYCAESYPTEICIKPPAYVNRDLMEMVHCNFEISWSHLARQNRITSAASAFRISTSTIPFLQLPTTMIGVQVNQSIHQGSRSIQWPKEIKKNKRNYYQWSSVPSRDSLWSDKQFHISLPIFCRWAHQQPPMTLSISSLSAFTRRFSSIIRLLLATIMWSTSTIRCLAGCLHQAWHAGSLEATCWWLFCLCMLTISCIM